MSSQKLQYTNSSVMMGFVWLIKCRNSFILRVRFYSIGVKREECNEEWVTDLVLLSGWCWAAIHLNVFPSADAQHPLVNLLEKGYVWLVLCSVPDESENKQVPGREATLGVYRTWDDPYLKCFPWWPSIFLLSWEINLQWHSSEVMPLTLVFPTPGHWSSLPPCQVPSRRGGQKLSGAALGASSSNALLGPTKADTYTRTCTCCLAAAQAWLHLATVCQPQLVGRLQLGLARSFWHMVSWSGREAVTPCYWCLRCQCQDGDVRGTGSRLCCTTQTACEMPQVSVTRIRWTRVSDCCHPFPKGMGFQTGVLFC